MNLEKIEQTLQDILKDESISASEKHSLSQLAESLDVEKVRFLRNRAFDIAIENLSEDPANFRHTMKWLEKLVKAIDITEPNDEPRSSAYFSPGEDCRNKILDLIKTAKHWIDICVFTISDDRLTDAILEAHRRGVKVRVISDNDKAADRGSDIDHLQDSGVPLHTDKSPNHMHHKFMLVDKSRLVNGSFNWTRSATEKNEENLIVTDDEALVESFQKQFNELWKKYQRS